MSREIEEIRARIARASRRLSRDVDRLLEFTRVDERETTQPVREPVREPDPVRPEPVDPPPSGWDGQIPRWAEIPRFPAPPDEYISVLPTEDPNLVTRAYFERNPDRSAVRLRIRGINPNQIRAGGKYGIHREGRPVSVFLEGNDPDAEVQGIEVDSYGGTFVENLYVDDLAVRKRAGTKSPVEDRTASGNWWFRKFRPRQNVTEAVQGTNYNGAKWGMKPSDGVEQLVVVDSPRVIDPVLREYPKWWEHYCYLTGCRKYYFSKTDLSGCNRTGFQSNTPRAGDWPWIAPEVDVVRDCLIEVGLEWNHNDGGSAITRWEQALGGNSWISHNTIKTRYGGISIAHQPPNAAQYDQYPTPHNLADDEGYTQQGYTFIINNSIWITEGTRNAISISSCRGAWIEGNSIRHDGGNGTPIVVDGGFAIKNSAPRCDPATIHINQPGITVGTYQDGSYVPHPAYR